jgi:hypothetical protein
MNDCNLLLTETAGGYQIASKMRHIILETKKFDHTVYYRINRNIANSAHIETMIISNSYIPTMIMNILEISEPLSLVSHVFGGT